MKKILFFLSLFIGLHAFAQRVYTTTIQGLNTMIYVPAGLDTTGPVNVLLFTPGAGEQGTDITKLLIHGPFQFLKAGLDNKARSVVIAVQNVNANPQPAEYQTYVDGIKKLYKVNKIILTGLSRGGQNAEWYANNSENNLAQIAGLIVFSSQGTVSDYPGIPGTLMPALYLKHNVPILRGEGDQDFTWPQNYAAHMALSAAAPKLDLWQVWKGAGHGDPVWINGYDPFPAASNPIYTLLGGKSIYQWADSVMGVTPPAPVAITYKNAAQSATYTKSNCSCGTPSAVVYTVAAGKYTSTVSQAAADQQAAIDMTTNGQAYANANGTCTPVLIVTITTVTKVMSDGTTQTTTTTQ